MTAITSRNNAWIKQIRALRSRKERERTGLFFVEGIRMTREALRCGTDVQAIVAAPDLLDRSRRRDFVESEFRARAPTVEVSTEVFSGLVDRTEPSGVGALVRQQWSALESVAPRDELCWVALASVQYPGNLGTILRTCEAVGSAGVILLGSATDPYDSMAVRASMGAIFSQRLVRTNLEAFYQWKEQTGIDVVGTSPAASEDYHAAAYRRPCVLLMGCESAGLSPEEQASCDLMVRIPMVGRTDSLNLAMATSILLYELFNQQRKQRTAVG